MPQVTGMSLLYFIINVFYTYLLSIWDEPCVCCRRISQRNVVPDLTQPPSQRWEGYVLGLPAARTDLWLPPCPVGVLPLFYPPRQPKIREIKSTGWKSPN